MNIHYMEIVTNDVDREVKLFETAQHLRFGEPVAELGGARVSRSRTGRSIGIRAPMHGAEVPVARPYFLTETIAETVDELSELGAEIALTPTKIEGHGTIAIYIVDGIQYGLWQV